MDAGFLLGPLYSCQRESQSSQSVIGQDPRPGLLPWLGAGSVLLWQWVEVLSDLLAVGELPPRWPHPEVPVRWSQHLS